MKVVQLVVAIAAAAACADAGAAARAAAPAAAPDVQLAIPSGPLALGSVRITRAVLADGKPLGPGSYRVRLTGDTAKPVEGEAHQLERWVEFLHGGAVKGRALAIIVPQSEVHAVAESRPPTPGKMRVEVLKGDDYYRIWFNRKGDQILVYLPLA